MFPFVFSVLDMKKILSLKHILLWIINPNNNITYTKLTYKFFLRSKFIHIIDMNMKGVCQTVVVTMFFLTKNPSISFLLDFSRTREPNEIKN